MRCCVEMLVQYVANDVQIWTYLFAEMLTANIYSDDCAVIFTMLPIRNVVNIMCNNVYIMSTMCVWLD